MNPNDRPLAKIVLTLGGVVLLIVLVLLLVGCDTTPEPQQDLDENNVDFVATPWTVYSNYDGFPNVAARCDSTTRMYTTTRASDSLIVVPDHPACQEGDR